MNFLMDSVLSKVVMYQQMKTVLEKLAIIPMVSKNFFIDENNIPENRILIFLFLYVI